MSPSRSLITTQLDKHLANVLYSPSVIDTCLSHKVLVLAQVDGQAGIKEDAC